MNTRQILPFPNNDPTPNTDNTTPPILSTVEPSGNPFIPTDTNTNTNNNHNHTHRRGKSFGFAFQS